MKPLPISDFRARRFMLERDDLVHSPGEYPGPVNLIDEGTWKSIVALPDDVSIRTSDKYGSQLAQMWDYRGIWSRVVGAVQALNKDPTKSPTATAACDAADEFQAAAFVALVGHYRVAFSCLRNILEQITVATQLAIRRDGNDFADWRGGSERIKFGWASDMLPGNSGVAALENHLRVNTNDSLFNQNPKGLARSFFVQVSKYTHGVAGYSDGDNRESNGPIFLPKTFLDWCVSALKTYLIVIHELKLAHPQLDDLPWDSQRLTVDDFRRSLLTDIPTADLERPFFQSLVDFWP